ncbi:hypothetical protein SSS_09135 [Sarcoptes scabiei]|uniref:Alpha-endosulfine n=1 Tax=Sarcoptes scabiei TaxID=52283 RepID=A0A834VD33_SARSC|nr:hypothetical protein SSS_09135 [Sarcoptes scabiei]
MASINETSKLTKDSRIAEKEEETKLKAKYPQLQRPGPQFLQKRLQKGQKFFDSGDYNMAKAAAAAKGTPKSRLTECKINQPAAGPQLPQPAAPLLSPTANTSILPPNTTGDAIPTPDCLATRKASIHVPSKLVSGGL